MLVTLRNLSYRQELAYAQQSLHRLQQALYCNVTGMPCLFRGRYAPVSVPNPCLLPKHVVSGITTALIPALHIPTCVSVLSGHRQCLPEPRRTTAVPEVRAQ